MVSVITYLLDQVAAVGWTITRLSLDRGCFSVPAIQWLHADDLSFVMPGIVCGKEHSTQALLKPTRPDKTSYTITAFTLHLVADTRSARAACLARIISQKDFP